MFFFLNIVGIEEPTIFGSIYYFEINSIGEYVYNGMVGYTFIFLVYFIIISLVIS